MLIKTLFLIFCLQGATQYALYDRKGEFIGNLNIYQDNLYIKITGYKADAFKIKFHEDKGAYLIYYIENDNMRGHVTIEQDKIIIRVLINKRDHKTETFYRQKV